MPNRILLRRDTSINWNYNNPVLMLGEPGYETDTGMLKIGDGQSPWSDLSHIIGEIGPTGATGPAGANGIAGSTGVTGPLEYKYLVAIVDQTGTSDPVVTEIKNTIGSFTYTRNQTGVYYFTSTSFDGFTSNNKVVFFLTNGQGQTGIYKAQYVPPISTVQLVTLSATGGNQLDGLLSNASIEIRLYN